MTKINLRWLLSKRMCLADGTVPSGIRDTGPTPPWGMGSARWYKILLSPTATVSAWVLWVCCPGAGLSLGQEVSWTLRTTPELSSSLGLKFKFLSHFSFKWYLIINDKVLSFISWFILKKGYDPTDSVSQRMTLLSTCRDPQRSWWQSNAQEQVVGGKLIQVLDGAYATPSEVSLLNHRHVGWLLAIFVCQIDLDGSRWPPSCH